MERRSNDAYDRSFYMTCAGLFALVALVGGISCLIAGPTADRLLAAFAGGWFLIYTMDRIEYRFRRDSDNVFWRRWFSLRGSARTQQKGPADSVDPTTGAAR